MKYKVYKEEGLFKWRKVNVRPVLIAVFLIIIILAGSCFTLYNKKSKVNVQIIRDTVVIEKYDNNINALLFDRIKVKNEKAFIYEVKAMAERMEIPYEHLIGVMYFESRLDPKASNKGNALGLFQLTSIAMKQMGITKAEVLKSDYIQQIEWFEQYLTPYRAKIHDFGDLYLAVYLPAYLGHDDRKISQKFLDANPPYRNCKTPGEFKIYITKQYENLKKL